MPHTHAAAKALRQTKKRQATNRTVKESIKTLTKRARKAVDSKQVDAAKTAVAAAVKALDKAVRRGVLKLNAASRKKSRLVRHLNTLLKA